MFMPLALRNSVRVEHYFPANICSKEMKNGLQDKLVLLHKAKANIYGSSMYFSSQPGTHITRTYAQTLWRMLCRIRSRSVSSFPATVIACGTCLALMKSHPSALGIFGYTTKDLQWRKAWAVAPSIYFPIHVPFESHRKVKLAHLTSSVFSVLKHLHFFVRAIYLAILFSPTMVRALLTDFSDVTARNKCFHLLIGALKKAGPAFITWAQWAATRPDLFPRDLCNELSKLQNKAPVHSFSYTKKTIEKAFGRKLLEFFYDFEEAPIASGGVSQVHRATLRSQYPGKEGNPIVVAVKVRHPGIRELFQMDFMILERFTNILRFTSKFKWLKLDESLQEISVLMKSEVDLVQKANLLACFCIRFHEWKDVSFPKPLFPLIHSAILVETYEKGDSLSRYVDNSIPLSEWSKRALVSVGTRAFMSMIQVHQYFVADMHPQNILVRIEKGEPHIIFLDVGVPAKISPGEALSLGSLFAAVGRRDGYIVANRALGLSKKESLPDPNVFIKDVIDSFRFWDTKRGGNIDPCECILRLLEKVRYYEMNIDGNVCTVIRSILALENWQRKLYPRSNMKVMQSMHIFVPQVVRPNTLYHYYTERGFPADRSFEPDLALSPSSTSESKWRRWVKLY